MIRVLTLSSATIGLLAMPLFSQVSFGGAQPLTAQENAVKGKLMRLVKTKLGARDGRLVSAYSDVGHTATVWNPKSGEYRPRDIFVRWSGDNGKTWSTPVNVSNTADKYSTKTDWSGDGVKTEYFGDSGKPTVFNNGDTIVVTWNDKYAPEAGWTWGASGSSAIQGSIGYTDANTFPNLRFVPFACMYAAVSLDGGETWKYGVQNPPLQLTYGRRDTLQNVVKGLGTNWIITWQEDPEGLQSGEAEGPGEGYSGAKVSKGTDIWYTYTPDITTAAVALRTNRTPLTDHSVYDTTGTNGFEMVGKAGSQSSHGASRANTALVKVGTGFMAAIAYEETKALPELDEGKTIQYHAFAFNTPIKAGTDNARYGAPGTGLSDERENSRRVRFVTQGSDGTQPAISLVWKQGLKAQGAPSDIMCRVSNSLTESAVAASTVINLSSHTPTATAANLGDETSLNAYEDARAHRGWIRGQYLVFGWSYTPNGPVARYTDLANYNFWIRRSFDGGKNWLAPQNLSNVIDTKINVLEPRLVGPANTGTQDDKSFVVAWGTETNVYEGIEVSRPLDVSITRTRDQGTTWEKVMPMAMTHRAEFESQIRLDDTVDQIYALWMRKNASSQDVMFAASGNKLWIDVNPSPISVGATSNLLLHAPGYANALYLALASLDTYPGVMTSTGLLPLNPDAMMNLSLVAQQNFVRFIGTIGATETASASVVIPNDSSLRGFEFWTGFVAFPATGAKGISNPAIIRID